MSGVQRLGGGSAYPQLPPNTAPARPGPEVRVVVSESYVTEIQLDHDADRLVIEHAATPEVVYVVDPVGSPVGLGLHMDDLADVDLDDVQTDTPLVWTLRDGVWTTTPLDEAPQWGQQIRVGDAVPDPADAPVGAVFLHWVDGTIYRAEE